VALRLSRRPCAHTSAASPPLLAAKLQPASAMSTQEPNGNRVPAQTTPPLTAVLVLAGLALLFALPWLTRAKAPRLIGYDELVQLVRQDRVQRVTIARSEVRGELKGGGGTAERVRAERVPGLDPADFVELLQQKGVAYSGEADESSWLSTLLNWILPLGLLALFFWSARRGATGGALRFGRAGAKIYDKRSASERVTFADVAGVDDAVADLSELVDFLKQPDRYRAIGAHVPRGVLLVGPPGSGKTLLARAVAGEADVPFFSITGSEFVEMFVGVGAARVRDLFEQARRNAPCIVFIDEIDAIGRSRGGIGAIATHDEREQTLNQLLAEMDGFDRAAGIVLMAATNRPEILDPALLRAGRFDRQVVVDRPDLRGREAILRVHTRKAKLAPSVDLAVVARRTPAMSGADLANVVNEAALAAARRHSGMIEMSDFEEAVDRIQLGLARRGRVIRDSEKRRIAFHEAGHALVALSLEHADPVHRVTIIPRALGALGATLQLPTDERYVMTREELRDRICVMLAGRAAEQLACGDVSTGALDDLERATATARQMICRFGMSDVIGPIALGSPAGLKYLDVPLELGATRDFSEETARRVDAALRALVEAEHDRARIILEDRRSALTRIAERLLLVETLDRIELDALIPAPAAALEPPAPIAAA
jgi:cell division protease FtsH